MNKDSIDYQHYFNIIKQSPIFSESSDDLLHTILNIFYVETWSKKKLYFHGEKTLKKFYIVVSGRIKVFKINPETGNEYILNINTTGDIFDVICLLDGKKHNIEMEALDDVVLLAAPIESVREWLIKHPEINKTILPYLGKQIRLYEESAVDLALLNTWSRTIKLFIKHLDPTRHSSQLKLLNNLSHTELAYMIGSARNVLNKHLQKLKEEKIIKVDRTHIDIKNMQALLDKYKSEQE